MTTETLIVANLKCNGCANTIKNELEKLPSVQNVKVDLESDSITLNYNEETRSNIIDKLHSLGYPEATEKNGLLLQIKSYASCMLGKINNLKTN
jgi:copper chaperone CopZ